MFSLPAVDRDESRFAQASRQMAEADSWRGWIVPRVQDKPRLNKPPLIYWLQAASVRLFTEPGTPAAGSTTPISNGRADAIWMYRIPSVLAAVLAVIFTWRAGLRMFDARVAWMAALLLALCPIMIWESKQARSDMVLLACTTAAMGALWRVYRAASRTRAAAGKASAFGAGSSGKPDSEKRRAKLRRRRAGWPAVIFWVAMALGVLVKGPITPLVAILACICISIVHRRWSWLWWLRPIRGILLVLAAIGTWAWLVAREVGTDEYLRIVSDEVLGRSVSAKEGHWGPPGYHLVVLVVLFWPSVLLTGAALGRAFRNGLRFRPEAWQDDSARETPREPRAPFFTRLRRALAARAPGRRTELFCLAWIVPSWLVFEFVGTKLPHYTMPLYPALALLSARALYAAETGRLASARTSGARAGYELWTIVGLALAAAPLGIWWQISTENEERLGVVGVVSALAAGAWILVAHHALRTRLRRRGHAHFIQGQACGLVAAGFIGLVLCAVFLPSLSKLATSRRAASVIYAVDPGGTRPIVCVGYQEDSLIFETHGRARRIDSSELQPALDADPSTLIVASAEAVANRTDLTTLADLSGFNYAKGKHVRVLVCERAPEPKVPPEPAPLPSPTEQPPAPTASTPK
jgi:4-amino-4-deoxy-L-arabinose transferase-like glycosyltransferase